MSNTESAVIGLVTVPDQKTGEEIANALVEKRLAACVNILPEMKSIYRWEGKIHNEGEVLMVIKTRGGLFDPDLISCARERSQDNNLFIHYEVCTADHLGHGDAMCGHSQ